MDKQRILKKAQKIAPRYKFWMFSGDISQERSRSCDKIKEKIALKLEKQDDVKCPHCETPLKDGNLKVISFQFKRDQ